MSACDGPPFTSPNWRSLRDTIVFVSRHFGSVRTAETKLYTALDARDLLSIRERADGVREPLTCWGEIEFSITSYIDHPGELMRDDDIEIARGFEALDPNLIFVWWPDVERLCGLTVAQPEPAKERPPPLRRILIIAILCRELPGGLSTDDVGRKTKLVGNHWEAECKAPLGDARRRVEYSKPDRKTVRNAIRDYLARPEAYAAYLKPR